MPRWKFAEPRLKAKPWSTCVPLGEDVSLKFYPLIGLLSHGRINGFADDPYEWA